LLPDARFLLAAAREFTRAAANLDRDARAWQPAASDAFTALVVMVPTMTEYFGQWKQSRFVLGDKATGRAFNVVSRLSDIRDILSGLQVTYAGVRPAIAGVDRAQASQTALELTDMKAFIADLLTRERAGERFTPEQAEVLGAQAQDRGTTIAGQVSQAAARLGIPIQQ
jgi:Imelysin